MKQAAAAATHAAAAKTAAETPAAETTEGAAHEHGGKPGHAPHGGKGDKDKDKEAPHGGKGDKAHGHAAATAKEKKRASPPPPPPPRRAESGVTRLLKREALREDAAQRFAASGDTWPTLCKGDAGAAAAADAAADCAKRPFDLTRYRSSATAMQAYAAYHAAFSRRSSAKQLIFRPDLRHGGLGERLLAMKSCLLLAMLTGRVFRVKWLDPYPLEMLLRPESLDWREPPQGFQVRASELAQLCLSPASAAAAPPSSSSSSSDDDGRSRAADCAAHLAALRTDDVGATHHAKRVLVVTGSADLHGHLAANPHYARTLGALGGDCPKRFGCLYQYLFAPQPVVEAQLARALRGGRHAPAGAEPPPYVGVQLRTRRWTREAATLTPAALDSAERLLECAGRHVPDAAIYPAIYLAADDEQLLVEARRRWADRVRAQEGGVFAPWDIPRGEAVDPATLADDDERALLKAFVDWFALQSASLIVYTHGSPYGLAAAESSDAPAIDVNHARCRAEERPDGTVRLGLPSSSELAYDT